MTTAIKGNDTSTFGGAIAANNVSAIVPAFSATMSASQALSASTTTKIAFDSEEFDTNSNFDSTTNYRFTPTVAGYYQINTTVFIIETNRAFIRLYKNGVAVKYGTDDPAGTRILASSWLVYLNGSSDYLEMYAWRQAAGNIEGADTDYTTFSGFLARAA